MTAAELCTHMVRMPPSRRNRRVEPKPHCPVFSKKLRTASLCPKSISAALLRKVANAKKRKHKPKMNSPELFFMLDLV